MRADCFRNRAEQRSRRGTLQRAWALLACGAAAWAQAPAQEGDKALHDLLELMKTPVVSASRTPERLSEAPATMVVLTQADLASRGYTELSQVLDDLPGMEVVRSYGANYFKDYWRGYRNDIGEPFLVLVDGLPFNHLWFNTADTPLVTYPLSAIDRVEVVYGPASAVYGANAFMGVINILTRKPKASGTTVRGAFTTGSLNRRIGDLSVAHRSGDLVFTLAARSDKGEMDEAAAERYEYTKRSYYANRRLWGSVVDQPDLAGSAGSPHQHSAVDARLAWGGTEFGVQQLWISSGYGTAYAADESQSLGRWTRPETSVFARRRLELSDRVASTATVRFRRSDVDRNSYDVESYYGFGSGSSTVLTFYEVLNSSLAYTQDFEIRASSSLSFNAGIKFEQKTLQKAYATTQGGAQRSAGGLGDANHFSTQDRGVYLQGRYRLDASSQFNLGLRSDNNSVYGTANTFRGGYVGTFGAWGVKALFGQAYQEPTARLLYGATSGTGSNANLQPERSHTAELSGSYTERSVSLALSLYHVKNSGTIQKLSGAVVNSGDQVVTGADFGFQWLLPARFAKQWKLWGYYSRYFQAEDVTPSPAGGLRNRSGDLADNKFWLGTTLDLDGHFSGTLLGRLVGSRPTVLSNPVREVGGYGTLDLALHWKDFWIKGLGLSFRAANLLDKAYFHPGLRDAGAGIAPGGFSGGAWRGSASYYSSLLPQPGRTVEFTVNLDF